MLLPAGSSLAVADDSAPVLEAGSTGIVMPALDMAKAISEDALADSKGNPGGWRYALPFGVQVSPRTHGKWMRLPTGQMQWQYRVQAASAVHVNFGFTTYWLPEGAELRIEATDGTEKIRPFTAADNESHRQLWTPPIATQDVTLTLTAPPDRYQQVELVLSRINQGYRGFNFPGKVCKSGNCNTDVACLATEDTWNRERRAVAAIGTNGERFCTGSLVNNTANDRRMLLATATHCNINSGNAASVIAYWNFESATCRRPGSAASGQVNVGPTSNFLTGSRFLVSSPAFNNSIGPAGNKSDWTLIELDDPPNPGSNLFWAGWDRSGTTPTCAVPAVASSTTGLCASIHHPNGDEKRITFSEQNMATSDIGNARNVHWQVQWDSTPPVLPNIVGSGALPPSVTEPGSSGSPLYNANHRLVGVLSGGASFCGAPTSQLNDQYGKLSHAWDYLDTTTTRLRDYLDPTNSGAITLNGIDSGPGCVPMTANLSVTPTSPNVDESTRLNLSISGGTAPYTVAWDVDDDGTIDRVATAIGGTTSLAPHYVRATSTTIKATIRDSQACSTEVSRAINVAGPDIVATAGVPTQLCGDNDAALEPGERWAVPVNLQNSGGNDVDNGVFVFVPGDTGTGDSSELAQTADAFGYTRADNTGPLCRFQAIDMSAQPALSPVAATDTISPFDDGAVSNLSLGPNPFNYYGQNFTQLQMSTNGYLSTSQNDGGGSYANTCGFFPTGADNGYLQALQDDLVVQTGGAMRHAYFANCPRQADAGSAAQGCTVFEWRNVGQYVSSNSTPEGNAVFQAILYDQSFEIVYQYLTPSSDLGESATIGIQNTSASVRNLYSCGNPAATANRAVCFFHPTRQPNTTNLRIDGRPYATVTSLNSGNTLSAGIPFQVSSTAACGAPLKISYLGMADDTAFSARSNTILNTVVGNGGTCNVSNCPLTTTPKALPRSGLYQNLNRLGSGTAAFNIPRDGNPTQFASVWYTAKADRSPYWYTQGGNWNDLNTQVETDITETKQTGTNPFTVSRTRAGNGWVTYVDDSAEYVYFWNLNGTLVGEKQLRFVDETGFSGDSNRSGGWFNPTESGWGATVTDFRSGSSSIRGILAFLFDAAGEPRWMTGSTTNLAANAQVPATTAFTHCPVCPNFDDFSSTTVSTGTMQMNFTNSTNATFNSSLNFPGSIGGSWNRTNTPMILITPPF
ncbi:hypothetical protein C7S18_12365 [Ahniella affigens]|uniref:Uncharacterized protein n=2 Tax=Ahniella affigens TaxID=2021234 RepID=A0A2P1PSY1_9GAMM|nr:hypothetical protein C7S18_12365 [Ahniella affigens]